jgi:hypothetical protein
MQQHIRSRTRHGDINSQQNTDITSLSYRVDSEVDKESTVWSVACMQRPQNTKKDFIMNVRIEAQ